MNMQKTGPRGGCTLLLFRVIIVGALLAGVGYLAKSSAHGMAAQFGTYSDTYLMKKAAKARKARKCVIDFRFDKALERGGEPIYTYGPCPKERK
jgi:hypothetical protein